MDRGAQTARLLSDTKPLPVGSDAPVSGPGLYAWWIEPARLRDATPPIPLISIGHESWSLLYVGIAPNGPRSSRGVSTRVTRDHRSGSIGNSTFRQSMAALLVDHLQLEPMAGYDRSRLADEVPLTRYIDRHCGLTTVAFSCPWKIETDIVRMLNPPLNLRPGFHEFRREVKAARDRLRLACGLSARAGSS